MIILGRRVSECVGALPNTPTRDETRVLLDLQRNAFAAALAALRLLHGGPNTNIELPQQDSGTCSTLFLLVIRVSVVHSSCCTVDEGAVVLFSVNDIQCEYALANARHFLSTNTATFDGMFGVM
jgi:hypothetical protein